ncbi:ATP-binding cassette domain-containing protein [Herbivorax sp. ANBcel31]|uniref:ATP-binding cassette domain-containing protein n=1 Tax=Herbivorax sp. ANBcel31 TaxID=3069754 RepID=UPI0027B6536C|nr:ATP-binding cassette domain-containing protein [Herbivorax sp. ANBcel31]MDQ2085076.1 ATP-binding cassette domain-containing protein [Herbivorax sp. ANBcel31]
MLDVNIVYKHIKCINIFRGIDVLEGVNILEKIYFKIEPGEIVGVLDNNSKYKTVLLKCIMNLTEISFGEVLLDGLPIREEAYKNIAYISGNRSLQRNLSPLEYEKFYRNLHTGFNIERFNELLNFLNIPKSKKVKSMSKKEQKELEIAIGLSKGAKYTLINEPFLDLDISERKKLINLILSKRKSDDTIIIATNNVEDIENIISRAIFLRNGRMAFDVTMKELKDKGESIYDIISKKVT